MIDLGEPLEPLFNTMLGGERIYTHDGHELGATIYNPGGLYDRLRGAMSQYVDWIDLQLFATLWRQTDGRMDALVIALTRDANK